MHDNSKNIPLRSLRLWAPENGVPGTDNGLWGARFRHGRRSWGIERSAERPAVATILAPGSSAQTRRALAAPVLQPGIGQR